MVVCGQDIKHVVRESQGNCTCAISCSCTKMELVIFLHLLVLKFYRCECGKLEPHMRYSSPHKTERCLWPPSICSNSHTCFGEILCDVNFLCFDWFNFAVEKSGKAIPLLNTFLLLHLHSKLPLRVKLLLSLDYLWFI